MGTIKMTDNSMLSFYRDHSVAPVRQKIAALDAHFARRMVLYQQLGIPAGAFTGRRVLEIGPGTGQNALFVAAQKPSQLVLVEPNPTGGKEIEVSFKPFPAWREILSIHKLPIEQFQDIQQFDFVLCEGLVGASGHPDPHALMSSIAKHVRPGGLMVITCIDYVGYLSEMLRRLLGYEISGHLEDVNQRVALMLPIFSPQLQTLNGMSRRFDDWIIDNLINPASVGRLVSFDNCLSYLGGRFDVLSTSPRFISDWTWYKKGAMDNDFFNRTALECYWRNLHNFIDYRYVYPPRLEAENRTLLARCEEIHNLINEYERTRNFTVRQQILVNLHMLRNELTGNIPAVSAALGEAIEWFSTTSIDVEAVKHSKKFANWFGRSQTYISLVRRLG
jgi:SAM-dependent methyltransferase